MGGGAMGGGAMGGGAMGGSAGLANGRGAAAASSGWSGASVGGGFAARALLRVRGGRRRRVDLRGR